MTTWISWSLWRGEACALSLATSLCYACSILFLFTNEARSSGPVTVFMMISRPDSQCQKVAVPCVIVSRKVYVADLPKSLKLLANFVCPTTQGHTFAHLSLTGFASLLVKLARSYTWRRVVDFWPTKTLFDVICHYIRGTWLCMSVSRLLRQLSCRLLSREQSMLFFACF